MSQLCAEHHKQDIHSCESELSYHLGEATYHLEQLLKSLQEVSVEINACCHHLGEATREIGRHVG
jgi:hypothetical protein